MSDDHGMTCDGCGRKLRAGIYVQARAFGTWEEMSQIRGRRVFGTGGDAGPQWPELHFCDLVCLTASEQLATKLKEMR